MKALDFGEVFKPTASTRDTLLGLVEAGFQSGSLQRTLDASRVSIWRWKEGETQPKGKAVERIDDIRCSMGKLLMKGMDPQQAAHWMQHRAEEPPHERPIEVLVEDPSRVFEMIDSLPTPTE
jgi:hypothetical protein